MRACKKIRILLNAVLIIALVMPFRTQHEPAVVFRDLNYQFEIEENALDVYTLRNCFRNASLIVEAECVGEATYGGNAISFEYLMFSQAIRKALKQLMFQQNIMSVNAAFSFLLMKTKANLVTEKYTFRSKTE